LYGHYESSADGDNQASFVQLHLGHRPHHLYLWHMGDKMGVLNTVLSQLLPAVGCNSDAVHVDTANVQQGLGRRRDDAEEREDRKRFRASLGASMSAIAIEGKENSIRKEEANCFKYEMLAIEETDPDKTALMEKYIRLAKERLARYEAELVVMKAGQLEEANAVNNNNGVRVASANQDDEDNE